MIRAIVWGFIAVAVLIVCIILSLVLNQVLLTFLAYHGWLTKDMPVPLLLTIFTGLVIIAVRMVIEVVGRKK